MLSADDYDAELAERYGWINRALPAKALGDFVRVLAHRIAGFPVVGQVVVKERVNALALAPAMVDLHGADHALDIEPHSYVLCVASAHSWTAEVGS